MKFLSVSVESVLRADEVQRKFVKRFNLNCFLENNVYINPYNAAEGKFSFDCPYLTFNQWFDYEGCEKEIGLNKETGLEIFGERVWKKVLEVESIMKYTLLDFELGVDPKWYYNHTNGVIILMKPKKRGRNFRKIIKGKDLNLLGFWRKTTTIDFCNYKFCIYVGYGFAL